MNTTPKHSVANPGAPSTQKRATAIQALVVSRRLRAYSRQRQLPSRQPAATQ